MIILRTSPVAWEDIRVNRPLRVQWHPPTTPPSSSLLKMIFLPLIPRLALGASLIFGAGACHLPQGMTGGSKPVATAEQPSYRWWDSPLAVSEGLAAVGSASLSNNPGMTRNSAVVSARTTLRTLLHAKVQGLTDSWLQSLELKGLEGQITGGALDSAALRSLMNNREFDLAFVSLYSRIAEARQRHGENGTHFVLVMVDDLDDFFDDLALLVDETIIAGDAFFITEESKDGARRSFREQLDAAQATAVENRAAFMDDSIQ